MAMLLTALAPFAAACSPSWKPAFEEKLDETRRGRTTIANTGDALSFARAEVGGQRQVLAVTRYEGGNVDAVNLSSLLGSGSADAIALFAERGYEPLRSAIDSAPASARISLPASALQQVFDCGERHIAAGTNYAEHAKDAGTTRPFLFPKHVQPGLSGDAVTSHDGLLDYEVEIAAVTLSPVSAAEAPRWLGFVVSNDFTDRKTLMHAIDRGDVESGKGFTTGKSFPGYLPIGKLLVIPRDWRSFVARLELELYVNGELRQRASASEMIWDLDETLRQIHARKDVRWQHRDKEVALYEGDAIEPRTLILTGTPHGTVFDGVPKGVIASGLLRWLAGGWSKSPPEQVIDAYVREARKARAYLQPGDEVLTRIDGLGEIVSRVES